MASADDIADSTDWLNTPLASLAPVENALHCQICKEFFDTPMITSCCHTFCSKCIRTALSTDGCCPACRTQDQASKLRNNWLVQELVSTFLAARPAALKVAREQNETGSQRPGKRKRNTGGADDVVQEAEGRLTRSKSRRVDAAHMLYDSRSEAGDDDDDDYTESAREAEVPQDDGLVECPLGCGIRMKIELVEPHLDRCEDERKAREKAAAIQRAQAKEPRAMQRLSELNYSMMKERDLSRKLKDLGIPAWGNKQLMVRRHTSWVNIWNANCDSSTPRNKGDLLRDLDAWERTHGGKAQVRDHGIMKKEFDGDTWSKRYQDDFSRLIQQARQSRAKATAKAADDAVPNASTDATTEASPDRISDLNQNVSPRHDRQLSPPHVVPLSSNWGSGRRGLIDQEAQEQQEVPAQGIQSLATDVHNAHEELRHWSQEPRARPDPPNHTNESLSCIVDSGTRKLPMFASPK